MSIQEGFDLIKNAIINTHILGIDWIISIPIIIITLLIITREYNKWKTLALPVMIGWHIIGIPQSVILYLVSSMLLAVDTMSLTQLGELINNIKIPKNKEDKLQKIARAEQERQTKKLFKQAWNTPSTANKSRTPEWKNVEEIINRTKRKW